MTSADQNRTGELPAFLGASVDPHKLDSRVSTVYSIVQSAYRTASKRVPYHGWRHIKFVAEKSILFGESLSAHLPTCFVAALVHDLNYLAERGEDENSGRELRAEILKAAQFSSAEIDKIESVVMEARTSTRHALITVEAQALSDADTAFKALPTTPLLSSEYIHETGTSLFDLAKKIVEEQTPLAESGIYFYSVLAKEMYGDDAESNLLLWRRVLASFSRSDVNMVFDEADLD